ncbi:MAG TPA: gluconate 2-dehydrogenase subunit 3 family protein [Gemmatimonadaceae bacterium]|nr:gluconate 2-dehydrogenase subunit 3 family protein [Gemmatimonadaceae bacterium]
MIDTNDTLIEYTPEMMTRREAVARVAALLGGAALIGGTALITGCRTDQNEIPFTPFTPNDIAYLDEIADTILPTTSTPGAKAAKTGELMARLVTDSYSLKDQRIFRAGMVKLDNASKDKNGGKTFMQATPAQRLALLKTLDKEQFDFSERHRLEELKKSKEFLAEGVQENAPKTESQQATAASDEPPNRYFRMMKELSLLGYFTSEIGCTQAQVYEEAPGRYDPCLPYKPGQKSWASHA